jgi:hypothetical protein
MTGHADVRLSYLVYTYRYSYQGTEKWKDGRLLSLTSTTNDDGKRFSVAAQAEGDTLRVEINGQEHRTRPDVWTTTCWRSPDPRFRGQALSLIDADTGKDLPGRLHYLGTSERMVAGQTRPCSHYRVTGGMQAELWFDDQERLVRKESMEDGHRTVIELSRVKR